MTDDPASLPVAAPRTRPRDRKQRIARAAANLFHRGGYHLVSMADIAAAVGITESALYRHFPSKQRLLHHVISSGIVAFNEAVEDEKGDDLDDIIRRLAGLALTERHVGLLWQRESRHLSPEQHAELRGLLRQIATALAAAVHIRRPRLSQEDAELLAWCALSVLTSPSYHRAELDGHEHEDLLCRTASAVVRVTPAAQPGTNANAGPARSRPRQRARSSRREQLLTAAVARFAKHGYAAVTMRQVGADIGISGPSIYNHFANKADLLWAALNRGGEALHLRLAHILETTPNSHAALDRLLADYATFTFEQHEIMRILISETPHLPDKQRKATLQSQHDYVVEWVALLREARPELDQPTARCLVQAALTIANDLSRNPRLRLRSALVTDIAIAGRAALFEPAGQAR